MAFDILVEDEFGTPRNNWCYSRLSEAKRVAKDAARYEQGRALISEDDVIVIEYKYEDGKVKGYDDLGNQVSGL